MEYKNGRIYQIRNNVDDDVYVGSTCQPLSKRMAKHRESITGKATLNRPLYVKMRELGVDCFYIELIEECPCENKEQLRKREGHFIREIATLNSNQAGRTHQEWQEENKEHVQENAHKYYEQNKKLIIKRSKEYNESHVEQVSVTKHKYYESHKEEIQTQVKQYREENKEKVAQSTKQYRDKNKDKIKEHVGARFECPCGGHYRHGDKAKHV